MKRCYPNDCGFVSSAARWIIPKTIPYFWKAQTIIFIFIGKDKGFRLLDLDGALVLRSRRVEEERQHRREHAIETKKPVSHKIRFSPSYLFLLYTLELECRRHLTPNITRIMKK